MRDFSRLFDLQLVELVRQLARKSNKGQEYVYKLPFMNIKCFIKGILCLTFIGRSLQSDGYLNPIKPLILYYILTYRLYLSPHIKSKMVLLIYQYISIYSIYQIVNGILLHYSYHEKTHIVPEHCTSLDTWGF